MNIQTERLGVSKLDYYFSLYGWLFREQMIHDFGIDAHVEITDENYPTGKLIAIQIKSGMSFFKEENTNGYIFRTKDKHIDYWSNHTLPVILVLYNTDEDVLYWQAINKQTVKSTGKRWKIEVPKTQRLDEHSLSALKELTQPEPYIQKLNKLKLDSFWMKKIDEGYDVYIEFDDWINKSLSRFQINISCEHETQAWPLVFCPGMTIEQALSFFIPWAEFKLDLDTHREGCIGQWDAECYMTYDKEEGRNIYGMSFDEWYVEPEGIVPYYQDGEIASYRLQLELNDLGRSFIKIDSFLSDNHELQGRTFTIDDY